jgi:hypothetical protein
MKRIKVLNIMILSAILVAFNASEPLSGYFIPQSAISIFSCDINSDTSNDLIVAHVTNWTETNPTISVLKNNGYGLFALADTSLSFCGGSHGNVFATKINNDSFPDIVTNHIDWSTGNIQNFVRVLYNDGQGNFSTFNDFPIGSDDLYDAIAKGDFNGDSLQNVAYVDNFPKKWAVMYNDGQGNLSAPVYYNLNYYPQDIATGDLDGDGRDDIVIAGYTEIYYSKPTGFQKQELNVDATQIHVVDMNNDEVKDIVSMNVFIGTTISIIENAGGQSFIEHPQTWIEYAFYNSTVCDLNNDSLPDLLYTTSNLDGINICYNQGDFTLGSPVLISIPYTGANSYNIFCADYDNNGFNDIALIESSGVTGPYPNLLLFFNDGLGNFLPDPITFIPGNTIPKANSFRNYPNPFHDKTTFDLTIKETSIVDISVYNANGKLTKCLMDHQLKRGHYVVSWNDTDKNDRLCDPGIYLVSFKINGKIEQTLKVLIY